MASSAEETIVLYHYAYSPYGRRVVWYLNIRGIPYSQCIQPPMMPRPDIAALGIKYRRIPILSIGRDVYLDTRLIIQKLEGLYPSKPKLAASDNDARAVERLLEVFTIDSGLFDVAMQLIPTDLPLFTRPEFYRDRADFAGADVSPASMARRRPEALGEAARAMALLETTLLADGRDWVLGTPTPGLADIEAVWPFHWLTGMPGALPADRFSPATYPRVYAWIARFQGAASAAKARLGKPPALSGEEAARVILQSPYHEAEALAYDSSDPVAVAEGLNKGDSVMVWPTDTGSSHREVGKLVGLSGQEVVIETVGRGGTVRVHAPRHGFRLRKHRAEDKTPKL